MHTIIQPIPTYLHSSDHSRSCYASELLYPCGTKWIHMLRLYISSYDNATLLLGQFQLLLRQETYPLSTTGTYSRNKWPQMGPGSSVITIADWCLYQLTASSYRYIAQWYQRTRAYFLSYKRNKVTKNHHQKPKEESIKQKQRVKDGNVHLQHGL